MGESVAGASALLIACICGACSGATESATALPGLAPRFAESPAPAATLELNSLSATPVCPPARGSGTVVPAISIFSITFVVDGLEQVLLDDDILQASPGGHVRLTEVTICTAPFQGTGGEACVDFVPVDRTGQEITAEHAGTHMVKVTPRFMTVAGPSRAWIIDDNWGQISAVLNHWPAVATADRACGRGRCERDDRAAAHMR